MSKRKGKSLNPSKIGVTNGKYSSINTHVDIVIPVYQRFDLLSECIRSIPEASDNYIYRVIIVDNGSPPEVANDFYSQINDPAIRVVRNKENLGFPKACNQGFDHGHSPLVFFLNSDVILKPKSIRYMIDEMGRDQSVGIASMKLIFPEQTDLPQNVRPPGKIQHIGLATNIRAEFIHQFSGWSADHPKVNAVREVYAVTGAAMMVRRVLFSKAGKFYEGYGMGTYEDVDMCLSVRKLGYNVIVVAKAEAIHHTNATTVTYKINYPLNENRMIFLQRWMKELDWTEYVYA